MKCPPGYDEIRKGMESHATYRDNINGEIHRRGYVLLKKTIYGLVQAARAWWKHLWTNLESLEFEKSKKDGCLFKRKNDKGTVIICAYVDDMLIIGDEEAVDDTHEGLRARYNIL